MDNLTTQLNLSNDSSKLPLKIYNLNHTQPEKWGGTSYFRGILDYKQLMADQYGLQFVDNVREADLIMFTLNSRDTFEKLEGKWQQFLRTCPKPVIIVERLDSGVTWFRQFDQIPNLVAVFKNRVTRRLEDQNQLMYNGRYHYALSRVEGDYYNNDAYAKLGWKYLPPVQPEDFKKIYPILWDFASSPLWGTCRAMNRYATVPKTQDVFCVNNGRETICGQVRLRAKNIVTGLTDLKVITQRLDSQTYQRKLGQCKICVACWGFGEWVHMDGYAMWAKIVLIKPDTGYVRMVPDLYVNHVRYVPCAPDYSDLEEVIRNVLANYDQYEQMLEDNYQLVSNYTEKQAVADFCHLVHQVYPKDEKLTNLY